MDKSRGLLLGVKIDFDHHWIVVGIIDWLIIERDRILERNYHAFPQVDIEVICSHEESIVSVCSLGKAHRVKEITPSSLREEEVFSLILISSSVDIRAKLEALPKHDVSCDIFIRLGWIRKFVEHGFPKSSHIVVIWLNSPKFRVIVPENWVLHLNSLFHSCLSWCGPGIGFLWSWSKSIVISWKGVESSYQCPFETKIFIGVSHEPTDIWACERNSKHIHVHCSDNWILEHFPTGVVVSIPMLNKGSRPCKGASRYYEGSSTWFKEILRSGLSLVESE